MNRLLICTYFPYKKRRGDNQEIHLFILDLQNFLYSCRVRLLLIIFGSPSPFELYSEDVMLLLSGRDIKKLVLCYRAEASLASQAFYVNPEGCAEVFNETVQLL